MRERPIIFSAPMVRAILSGTKTQTRRVVKPWEPRPNSAESRVPGDLVYLPDGNYYRRGCHYGQPGDRLWVRETWLPRAAGTAALYRADICEVEAAGIAGMYSDTCRWRSPIHMPRWASRITLEVTGVRVERLQQISDSDCLAEGIEQVGAPAQLQSGESVQVGKLGSRYSTARALYADLWESINGPGSWAANPWVWVVEFTRIDTGAV